MYERDNEKSGVGGLDVVLMREGFWQNIVRVSHYWSSHKTTENITEEQVSKFKRKTEVKIKKAFNSSEQD